jgi:uncharacterized protein
LFGIYHWRGFPGGLSGSVMVFFWSVFLGIIKYRTKGMLMPVIAHIFADLTIFILIFVFLY